MLQLQITSLVKFQIKHYPARWKKANRKLSFLRPVGKQICLQLDHINYETFIKHLNNIFLKPLNCDGLSTFFSGLKWILSFYFLIIDFL